MNPHPRLKGLPLLCVLLSLFLWVLILPARGMQFDVFLGYDSMVSEAGWFPVVFEVKNDGATFSGYIELTTGSIKKNQSRKVFLELPTGTLKRVTIPVFCSTRFANMNSMEAQLVDDHGHVRESRPNIQPRRAIANGIPLMGALPRSTTGLPQIVKIKNLSEDLQPGVARLLPSTFPDNPIALQGLTHIYLNSERAIELNATQVEALLCWLNAGGHLIIGIEQISDVNATPWLKSLVPCNLSDLKSISSHAELQDWLTHESERERPSAFHHKLKKNKSEEHFNPYAGAVLDSLFEHSDLQVVTGTLRGGYPVVNTSGDIPLILESDQGFGRVTTLMFSPERKPFSDWKNADWFWTKLMDPPTELYKENSNLSNPGGWSSDGIFGAMIDSRQVRKLPVGWLLLLLVIYLAVIGPVDQYWLKKIRRPMLTWITFPCYVVLFSLLIYYIGYRLRAGDCEWNELHIVDVMPRGQGAELKGQSFVSIYSPVNNDYEVQNTQDFSTFRGEFLSSWSGGQETERADIQQSTDSVKARIFVPVWTSQLFVSDWWQKAEIPISFSVTKQPNEVDITVTNQLDHALQNFTVMLGDKYFQFESLGAKETKTFSQSLDAAHPMSDFLITQGQKFTGVVQARQNAFGSSGREHIDDLYSALRAISFISHIQDQRFTVPPGIDLSDSVGNDRAILLAWDPKFAPIQPMNKFTALRSARNTLWRLSTPVISTIANPH